MARAGRRPGPNGTRDDILDAARRLFGERGFDGTTIRAIAAEARVNPALVHHFFGSKEQVFVAAVNFPINPAEVLPVILDGPRDELGQRVARFVLSIWREPRTRGPLLALLRSAVSNEQAAGMVRDFLSRIVLNRIAAATGGSPTRVAAAGGQMIGLLLLRYVVRVEPLASADDEEIVAILAPVIQDALTGGSAAPSTSASPGAAAPPGGLAAPGGSDAVAGSDPR
jgi:AcrR family transcriptional regulator